MAARRLLADIGGTNARFALTSRTGRPTAEKKLRTADYPGPVEAVRAYLGDRQVDEAVFAMALPVEGDRVHLTNSPWAFSIEATRAALGLERLTVINDFSAQALAIPALTEKERRQIGGGEPVEGAPIGVIGPGTGLGVGGLLFIEGAWRPVASEGGHVSFAPYDESGAAVLAQLRERFGHVSNERLLSGPGLVNLATALAALEGQQLGIDDPAEVTRRARAGRCRFCREALGRFSGLLGAAAGDLALLLCARGGVYIGGGLVKRLDDLFDAEQFRERFVAKGRFVDYLGAVPTYLVTRRDPGLLGAASLRTAP
jgi:glucokinase